MLVGVLLGALGSAAAAADSTQMSTSEARSARADPTRVRVVIKPLTPFVMIDGDRQEGFSVDLWDEIASRNGWQTDWVHVETIDELLAGVSGGEADAGIAGISVTADREEQLDFSHPMFDSGLQIMVSQNHESSMWSKARALFSGSLLKFLAVMVIALVIGGHVVWLVQRRDGRAPRAYLPGVSYGIWISGVTALAGDIEAPRRWIGRIVAMVWILIGVVAVALFTATVTTQLTVDSITGDIRSMSDLPGKKVVTVAGSTSDTYLRRVGIDHTTVTSIDDAYPVLRSHEIDAIVYDAPVLRYRVSTVGRGRERLVGPIFDNEAYGIAFPTESKLTEPVNRALLAIRADGTYDRIYQRWFGSGG